MMMMMMMMIIILRCCVYCTAYTAYIYPEREATNSSSVKCEQP